MGRAVPGHGEPGLITCLQQGLYRVMCAKAVGKGPEGTEGKVLGALASAVICFKQLVSQACSGVLGQLATHLILYRYVMPT